MGVDKAGFLLLVFCVTRRKQASSRNRKAWGRGMAASAHLWWLLHGIVGFTWPTSDPAACLLLQYILRSQGKGVVDRGPL